MKNAKQNTKIAPANSFKELCEIALKRLSKRKRLSTVKIYDLDFVNTSSPMLVSNSYDKFLISYEGLCTEKLREDFEKICYDNPFQTVVFRNDNKYFVFKSDRINEGWLWGGIFLTEHEVRQFIKKHK